MKKATIYDYVRMCKHFDDDCQECPVFYQQTKTGLNCEDFIRHFPDKANEIILKWCEEHPVETRQDRFLKMFPNADTSYGGYLDIEPCNIDKSLFDNEACSPRDCEECKKEYWLAEVDENE